MMIEWKYDRKAKADVLEDPEIAPGNYMVSEDECLCHLCGDRNAMAHWSGMLADFLVCYECAAEKLPLLIADAYASRAGRFPAWHSRMNPQQVLKRVNSEFWRGLALAINTRLGNLGADQHPEESEFPHTDQDPS